MIGLWELRGNNDCRYSTFAWRARLALLHKGLPFELHPVSVIDKAALGFSGQDKVPVIRDGERVVSDSWAIAVYLERTYPDRPSLFGGPNGENLTRFFNQWVDRELVSAVVPALMRDLVDCVGVEEAKHHRAQMEGIFKKPLEDLYAERGKVIEQFRKRLAPARKILEKSPFMGGDRPSYADYILFSVPQWARIASQENLFAADDAVAGWFERMLDLYDGAGRRELSRAERSKSAAA